MGIQISHQHVGDSLSTDSPGMIPASGRSRVLVTFWTGGLSPPVPPFTAWAMLLGHQLYLALTSSLPVSMSPRNDSCVSETQARVDRWFTGAVQSSQALSLLCHTTPGHMSLCPRYSNTYLISFLKLSSVFSFSRIFLVFSLSPREAQNTLCKSQIFLSA